MVECKCPNCGVALSISIGSASNLIADVKLETELVSRIAAGNQLIRLRNSRKGSVTWMASEDIQKYIESFGVKYRAISVARRLRDLGWESCMVMNKRGFTKNDACSAA